MFWNKKKTKSKPQIKTTVPKTFKAKEPVSYTHLTLPTNSLV